MTSLGRDYSMRMAYLLTAILITLPFLDCICDSSSNSSFACNHCDSKSFPISEHDCLEEVEFFFSNEFSSSVIYYQECFAVLDLSPYPDLLSVCIPIGERLVWFGKQKSNLALKIIQV